MTITFKNDNNVAKDDSLETTLTRERLLRVDLGILRKEKKGLRSKLK